MDLYPAIDLRAGGAVRLTQGDFEREVRYGDPSRLAERFIEGGAPWLHVVDLDAARSGIPHERAVLGALAELAAAAHPAVRVQAGGGIRTEADVESVLALGVHRVVLGTAALEDPSFAASCARRWPGCVAVGLDYAGSNGSRGAARAQGWAVRSPRPIPELLREWEEEPLGAVVATSIARDGMLQGPDLEGLAALLSATALPVIASGGVGSLEDLAALAGLEAGGRRLAGAIAGKALAEGRFSVAEGVKACAPSA